MEQPTIIVQEYDHGAHEVKREVAITTSEEGVTYLMATQGRGYKGYASVPLTRDEMLNIAMALICRVRDLEALENIKKGS